MANRFAKFKVESDLPEDFGQPGKKEGPTKVFPFRPGLYKDLEIVEVTEGNPARKDPSWISYRFKFRAGRNEISKFVMVPTESLTYGLDRSAGVFSMLVRFLQAFGIDLNKNNAQEVIPALFENPEIFVGHKVDAQISHRGFYAHYVDKNTFHVMDSFDRPVCEKGTQNPIVFPSQDACEVYVLDFLKQEFSAFPEVKYVNPPSTKPDKPLMLPQKKKEEPKKKFSW